jgi:putative hemolysin
VSTLELTGWLALAVASIAAGFLASGVELGCYSLNRIRLAVRAGRTPPDVRARTLDAELKQPDRLIAALLVSQQVLGALSALAVSRMLAASGQPEWAIALINTAILGPVLFIATEVVPKELFRTEADTLTYRFASSMRVLRIALSYAGVTLLVRGVSRVVERLAGLSDDAEHLAEPRQRTAAMLKESAAAGVLSGDQSALIDSALAFTRARVEAAMVPWAAVRTLSAGVARAEALAALRTSSHSRFPVVDPQGRCVGVLRQIDLHLFPDAKPEKLLVQPARLRSDVTLPEALRLLRDSHARVGIVERDNTPIGLVTAKDLAETLTGNLAGW